MRTEDNPVIGEVMKFSCRYPKYGLTQDNYLKIIYTAPNPISFRDIKIKMIAVCNTILKPM